MYLKLVRKMCTWLALFICCVGLGRGMCIVVDSFRSTEHETFAIPECSLYGVVSFAMYSLTSCQNKVRFLRNFGVLFSNFLLVLGSSVCDVCIRMWCWKVS